MKAAFLRLDSARLLPFSPTFIGGFSADAFGGGSNIFANNGGSRFDNFGSRSDTDLVFYWSLQNLGVGNKALIDAACARLQRTQFGANGRTGPRPRRSRCGVRAVARPVCLVGNIRASRSKRVSTLSAKIS